MKRFVAIGLAWFISIALSAGTAYWVGRHRVSSQQASSPQASSPQAPSAPTPVPDGQKTIPDDLQIVQQLAASDRQRLLHAKSVVVSEGVVVSVVEPGKPPKQFLAQAKPNSPKFDPTKRPPGKLDLPDTKNPPPFNYKPDKEPPPTRAPRRIAYPCLVTNNGKQHMGVCFRMEF
jgi:hypothetical protein